MYKYLGDRMTDPKYKGQHCEAVRRQDGKCLPGKNGCRRVNGSHRPIIKNNQTIEEYSSRFMRASLITLALWFIVIFSLCVFCSAELLVEDEQTVEPWL